MRPLWKGAVSFGLVFVPVKLYAATEKRTSALIICMKNAKHRYSTGASVLIARQRFLWTKLSGVMNMKRVNI